MKLVFMFSLFVALFISGCQSFDLEEDTSEKVLIQESLGYIDDGYYLSNLYYEQKIPEDYCENEENVQRCNILRHIGPAESFLNFNPRLYTIDVSGKVELQYRIIPLIPSVDTYRIGFATIDPVTGSFGEFIMSDTFLVPYNLSIYHFFTLDLYVYNTSLRRQFRVRLFDPEELLAEEAITIAPYVNEE